MQVSGIILDDLGVPLPGTHVEVQGNKNIGDTTDFDGKFIINNQAVTPTTLLAISYLGFKTLYINASFFGGKQPIKMVIDSTVLKPTTIYGYKKPSYWWLLLLALPIGYHLRKKNPKKITI
jgi:hypothetical protein